jgi:hypothetical protein
LVVILLWLSDFSQCYHYSKNMILSNKIILISTVFISLLINFLYQFLAWYSLSPFGSFKIQQFSVVLLSLTIVTIALLVLLSLLCVLFSIRRSLFLKVLGACFIYIFITWVITSSFDFRTNEFERLAQRSVTLIEAIKKYEHDKGHPPVILDDLLPNYIERIPNTDMGAYPSYKYEQVREHDQRHGNPWVLYLEAPLGILNFDSFLYYPNQNYPESIDGDPIQKIGDWVYVHE